MRKIIVSSGVLFWLLFVAFAFAATIPVVLTVVYSPGFGFLNVPFASWFVLGLRGLILMLDGVALYFWRRFRKTSQELLGLKKQPLEEEIPTVYGHEHLDRAEFLPIMQTLFRRPPDVRYIHVERLAGRVWRQHNRTGPTSARTEHAPLATLLRDQVGRQARDD